MPINSKSSSPTPLQRILGFDVAEETYDQLALREQLILDLLIEGWSQDDIANVLGISQGWVSIIIKRIRFKLAKDNLKLTLEIRQHYRDSLIRDGVSENQYVNATDDDINISN